MFILYLITDCEEFIMEPDRFLQNQKSYIIGIVCLVVSLGMFAFSLYVFPFLIFGWHYGIPSFLSIWMISLQDYYHLSETAASWLIFLGLFLAGVFLAIIADVLSNQIDNQIYGISPDKSVKKVKKPNPSNTETKGLVFKLLIIMLLVFFVAEFFQWAISSPSV